MPDQLRIAVRAFPPFTAAIQQQWDTFRVESGCPLELDAVSLDLNPLVETLFTGGGLRDGAWDIAFIVTDWIADAVATGSLLDLAPLMRANPIPAYPDPWSPALRRFQEIDGAVYGIPYHDGPECLIYRTDLFDDPAEQAAFEARHGRPLTVPTTWDEFAEVARYFTKPDDGLFGTVFAAFPDGHNTVYDVCLQLWSRGGDLADASGQPTLISSEMVAALDTYRRFVNDRGMTPPGLDKIDSVASGELFARGEIAMMVNWFGFAATCEQPGSPTKGKVGVAPVPAGPGGQGVSLNVYWVLAVAAGSRHPEVAYDFIRSATSAAGDKITTLAGGIGCRRSTWADPEVNAAVPFFGHLAELHEHARELPRSQAFPALVHVIDAAVSQAIKTDEPSGAILHRAQTEADRLGIRL